MPSLQLPTVPFVNQQSISNLSSPSQELSEPGFAVKKTSDSVPTPPKVSQLSTLEQELAKLHTNRRNTTADTTTQQIQSPATGESHTKTYSEVVQQQPQIQQQQHESGQGHAPLTTEPPRVRKISRFAVSVVKEQQDAAAAAAAKQIQHQLTEMAPQVVSQQTPQQQTIGAQIAAQVPMAQQMTMPQPIPVMTQQGQAQLHQQQSKPQLNLNLQGLTVQQQIPIQIQQQQQQAMHESSSTLKPIGK